LGNKSLLVKVVHKAFGSDALTLGVYDIHIAREHKPAFLGKVLRLPGCSHHSPIGISDSHVSSCRHHTGLVITLLHV
jgi:hypothetical protein